MEMLFGRKRRPSLCLSLSSNSPKRPFTTLEDSPEPDMSSRSPFYNPGAVGLGMIAKVSDQEPGLNPSRRIFMSPMLFRTPKAGTVNPLISESHTMPRKSIDFDRDDGADDYSFSRDVKGLREQGIGPYSNHFLSCCRLCKKSLHGLDIFMYRGYKAFCSPECREEYMKADKCKDMDDLAGHSGSSLLSKKVAAAARNSSSPVSK